MNTNDNYTQATPVPVILSVQEACAWLRVSPRQLRRWRAAGLIEAVVSTTRPRYRVDDLLEAARHLGTHPLPR